MNINAELGVFRTLIIAYFLNNTKTHKINTKIFFENRGQTLIENAMILTCVKIQGKVLMFGEVGAPESSFCD